MRFILRSFHAHARSFPWRRKRTVAPFPWQVRTSCRPSAVLAFPTTPSSLPRHPLIHCAAAKSDPPACMPLPAGAARLPPEPLCLPARAATERKDSWGLLTPPPTERKYFGVWFKDC
ncbi:hypothetical protein DAI22_12g193950 [Oryza sativa Japonica Group]|nr:hypothetical protein DAI22_12g193950 [Oryza sativa Japonica Group]